MVGLGFRKVAILGGGLLGGSLAMALKGRGESVLWARREVSVVRARERGVTAATDDLSEALCGADLVILSVPVGVMGRLVDQALEAGLEPGALVSDVGSVKQVVHRDLAPRLRKAGIVFIGGHPMAGSEKQGIEACRPDLFNGASCILTDDENVGEPWTAKLEEFWRDLGCRVDWQDARSHDELVARISHFPHVMAAAAARVALEQAEDASFGGGGLRDTTRVAGGDPGMWAEILMENRGPVAASVRATLDDMAKMLSMLDSGDHDALREWLDHAKQLHEAGRSYRIPSQ